MYYLFYFIFNCNFKKGGRGMGNASYDIALAEHEIYGY